MGDPSLCEPLSVAIRFPNDSLNPLVKPCFRKSAYGSGTAGLKNTVKPTSAPRHTNLNSLKTYNIPSRHRRNKDRGEKTQSENILR